LTGGSRLPRKGRDTAPHGQSRCAGAKPFYLRHFFRIFCSVLTFCGALLGEQTMTDSQRLLAEYAKNGSESAFQELVSRYLNFVYSTALRLVGGDASLAEDVAQTVFIGLARRGRMLSPDVMLGGWLHQHTYHVATRAARAERRRQFREHEAMEMNALHDDPGAGLRQVAPILDEAITQLGSEDRTAILLRFFEQRDFRSVGEALGSNEDAARMRVNRALEKLHSLLKHRGVTLSAAALGTALTAEAVTAAPAGLAVTISGVALAGAASGTGTALALLKFMTATKLNLGIAALMAAGVMTTFMIQRQALEKLRGEKESLRLQITQLQSDNQSLSNHVAEAGRRARLSAPPARFVAAPAAPSTGPATNDLPSTALIAQLFKGANAPKLTHEQVEAYLKANGRNGTNLLAAFDASGDPALLHEAMEKYPNDPQVDFRAALDKDLPPEQQRQWLNAFEQSAPDNALANYLSALDYFKSGQNDQAVQELNAASRKSQFQDYTLDSVQSREEAFLAAGYSAADAGMIAEATTPLPQVAALKQLGQNIVGLANAYQQSGDPASAQSALQMAVNLGRNLDDNESGAPFLINTLAGMNIERNALSAMDPNTPYGGAGQTVQDQLNQLAQQKTALKSLNDQFNDAAVPMMSPQDWLSYQQRHNIFGEAAADQWAIGKYGRQ
jgi:RNA polymerase sigma factor (sigma-70 family)